MDLVQNDVNNAANVTPSGVVEAAPTNQQQSVDVAPSAAQANQIAAADVQQGVSQQATGIDQGQQQANQQVQQNVQQGAAVTDPLMQQAQQQQLGPVPYDRFKEVNDAKNAMATELEQIKQTAQLQQMISAGQQQLIVAYQLPFPQVGLGGSRE